MIIKIESSQKKGVDHTWSTSRMQCSYFTGNIYKKPLTQVLMQSSDKKLLKYLNRRHCTNSTSTNLWKGIRIPFSYSPAPLLLHRELIWYQWSSLLNSKFEHSCFSKGKLLQHLICLFNYHAKTILQSKTYLNELEAK